MYGTLILFYFFYTFCVYFNKYLSTDAIISFNKQFILTFRQMGDIFFYPKISYYININAHQKKWANIDQLRAVSLKRIHWNEKEIVFYPRLFFCSKSSKSRKHLKREMFTFTATKQEALVYRSGSFSGKTENSKWQTVKMFALWVLNCCRCWKCCEYYECLFILT